MSAGYCEDTVYFLEAGYDTACLAPAGPFRIRDCMTPYSIYLPYQDYSLLRPVPVRILSSKAKANNISSGQINIYPNSTGRVYDF
mgnify:CR=1 FL=1